MDPRDDDIDFDFFEDEAATTERASPQSRVRLPRRGGRGTGMRRSAGPPRGLTPLLRLLALIAVLVAVLVFFGLVIQSCAATSKHARYQHYMAQVATIAHSSEDDGASVADALTTPGTKVSGLTAKLAGLAEQERQNVAAAERLNPPGPLRDENRAVIQALQLRVSGVAGLAKTFTTTATSKSSGDAAILAAQAERLLAGDVVWDDFFKDPAAAAMAAKGVSGVVAPDSNFVSNPDFITEHSMGLVLQRLRGASTSGTPSGIHGTNIVSTKVDPGGHVLSETADNTITASIDLAVVVSVHDGGDSQEVGINVTLTIDKPGHPIVKTKTIKVINPGANATVTFKNLGDLPFGQKSAIHVDVARVPSEKDASNNKASYPALFTIG